MYFTGFLWRVNKIPRTVSGTLKAIMSHYGLQLPVKFFFLVLMYSFPIDLIEALSTFLLLSWVCVFKKLLFNCIFITIGHKMMCQWRWECLFLISTTKFSLSFPTILLYGNSVALLNFCKSVQKRPMGRFPRSWNQYMISFFNRGLCIFHICIPRTQLA